MKLKRILASALVLAMSLSLCLPIAATESSFSDVTDSETAMNADVLRLMGVVSGTGSNQFNPSSTLTRGEFCVMLVSYMGMSDSVAMHTTRTIFTDVPSSHWAAGYINLASSITLPNGEESTSRLISGMGDGSFLPNAPITYAQAVTILLRVLGYNDQQAGAMWPIGYLNLAKSLGLTDGLSLSPSAKLTRQDAAKLFVQALSSETAKGGPYYKERANMVHENVILLATNVSTAGDPKGAIRTSHGTYLPENRGVNPSGLQGHRGVLLLNEKQEIITFLPDPSTSVNLTLSVNAEATYISGSNGNRYNIAPTTPTFISGTETKDSTYSEAWTNLKAGTQVTLFMEDGHVVGVFAGLTTSSGGAVVVENTPRRDQFYSLTGGNTEFGIRKNGVEIKVNEIQEYDVVTYDSMNNTLVVSDLRLTAVYESGLPNTTTPTTIKTLGHEFTVLDSAMGASDHINRGSMATFLFTASGEIAAMLTPSSSARSTMIGIAGETDVTVTLPNGEELILKSTSEINDNARNKLVTVSSIAAGRISATPISGRAPGDFNIKDMTLGNLTVSPSFGLYEQVSGGAVTQLPISALDMDSIPSNDIAGYRADSSGNVDVIILDGVTGDSYTYGKLIDGGKAGGGNRTISIENSGNGTSDKITGLISNFPFKDGVFGGATIGHTKTVVVSDTNGNESSTDYSYAGSVIILEAIDGVTRGDFFTVDGKDYVKANGRTYRVADNVECYNEDYKNGNPWVTFNDLKAYSDDITIHIDPLGEKVRVISATE